MSSCHQGPNGLDVAIGQVLLVGNPNVGKSTVFNAMTGSRQRVMNAPGTTVELQTGTWRTDTGELGVVDLPGTYSLFARSPDEQVVADALRAAGPDAVAVVVLDATALSRSLYLLAQVASTGLPVVAAVTMIDVARTHGTAPDASALAHLLGIPVVLLDPRTGAGLPQLAAAVQAHDGRPVTGVPVSAEPRDDDLASRLAGAEHLFAWVEDVTSHLQPHRPGHRTVTDAVDRILLNPWSGIPVLGLTMWALFQLATTAAAPAMGLVARTVTGPLTAAARAVLRGWAPPWLDGLLVDGILAGVGTVLSFVPLIAIIYAALALLEDSGYMARAALLADRAMRSLGLDGRAMLPLMIGFGCNVPALSATRILPDARQRLITGLLIPWTSCAARLTVYVLLAGVFFPDHAGTVIFALYVLSIGLVVTGGLVLRRTAFREVRREALVLVLPAYQRPRLLPIARSVWSRVASFATKAGRIIVVTLTLMWVLMAVPTEPGHPIGDVPVEASVYGRVAVGIAPVFAPAGFDDWHLAAALATGFVAKEVVVGSLAQSYAVAMPDTAEANGAAAADGADRALADGLRTTLAATSGGHPAAAAAAFMVFVLGYTPCVATLAEQRRLFGLRWTAGAMGVQLVTAWLLAVAVFQVGRLL